MSDKHKHPLRRKHRRGKRGGKKNRALAIQPTPPEKIVSLRQRLHALKQRTA